MTSPAKEHGWYYCFTQIEHCTRTAWYETGKRCAKPRSLLDCSLASKHINLFLHISSSEEGSSCSFCTVSWRLIVTRWSFLLFDIRCKTKPSVAMTTTTPAQCQTNIIVAIFSCKTSEHTLVTNALKLKPWIWQLKRSFSQVVLTISLAIPKNRALGSDVTYVLGKEEHTIGKEHCAVSGPLASALE